VFPSRRDVCLRASLVVLTPIFSAKRGRPLMAARTEAAASLNFVVALITLRR
jgi:hypothetical protein